MQCEIPRDMLSCVALQYRLLVVQKNTHVFRVHQATNKLSSALVMKFCDMKLYMAQLNTDKVWAVCTLSVRIVRKTAGSVIIRYLFLV